VANARRRVRPALGTFAGELNVHGAAFEPLSGGTDWSAHVPRQAEIYAVRTSAVCPVATLLRRCVERIANRTNLFQVTSHFVSVGDDIPRSHLAGRASGNAADFTVGVYPMLPDETCWFLAADFDTKSWMKDVAAFRDRALAKNVEERPRRRSWRNARWPARSNR
jgi:hypothetical protein